MPGRLALKPLGGGSAYDVYLVWDEQLFALAVAKLLRPERVTDPYALRDLRREAELLDRLAHPSLVRGFGAVLDGPRPHVLLEYAEGPTLRQVVKKQGPLQTEQLVPLALHLASVLQYLASKRVVHLDVKPGNLVLGVTPRLIDLSIARSFESAARLRVAVGTEGYMAPEQCDPVSSASTIGPAADVWALGATLYYACIGQPPFPRAKDANGADPAVRFPQMLRQAPPLPKHIPAPLTHTIHQMLRMDPDERPSLRDVVASLGPLIHDRHKRRVGIR